MLGSIRGERSTVGETKGRIDRTTGPYGESAGKSITTGQSRSPTISAGQHHAEDDLKKISSWAAILFAPTLVGTIYGMNFDAMPELNWTFGYPFAILLMALVCVSPYFVFKRRDWL